MLKETVKKYPSIVIACSLLQSVALTITSVKMMISSN